MRIEGGKPKEVSFHLPPQAPKGLQTRSRVHWGIGEFGLGAQRPGGGYLEALRSTPPAVLSERG